MIPQLDTKNWYKIWPWYWYKIWPWDLETVLISYHIWKLCWSHTIFGKCFRPIFGNCADLIPYLETVFVSYLETVLISYHIWKMFSSNIWKLCWSHTIFGKCFRPIFGNCARTPNYITTQITAGGVVPTNKFDLPSKHTTISNYVITNVNREFAKRAD